MKKLKHMEWLILLAAVVIVNIIAARFHYRFDLTEEKRYSITPATQELLQQLDDDVTIDVFLTGEMPAEFKRLQNATEEFLSELREANPEHIRYRFLDPLDEADDRAAWADSLQKMGASPVNLNVQLKAGEETRVLYPYAIVRQKDQYILVNIFQTSKRNLSAAEVNNAEAMLEYQFARSIHQLVSPQQAAVAYAVGHGEPVGAEAYDLQQTISSGYRFGIFNIAAQRSIPKEIDVLLIVKPSVPFSDADKLKLDQYVMHGGKIIWFIDNLFAEQDSLSIKSQLIAYERGLNVEDLLFNYGVRINPDLLMDLQCDFLPFVVGGTGSDPQYEFLKWNYYPLFESQRNHLINKTLGLVAGRYVNSIDTVEKAGVKKTFLLQSSPNSRTISTPALISPNENRNAPDDLLFNKGGIPSAVILEGRFTSLFRNRISRAQADTLAQYGGFREASEESKMIVVADGDMVLNDVSPREGPVPMGVNLFTIGTQYEYQFANRDFLLNCLEYLTSTSSIISTRNKEIVLRMLDMKRVGEEKIRWQLINMALPILLIIMFGFVYRQVRTYAYAK